MAPPLEDADRGFAVPVALAELCAAALLPSLAQATLELSEPFQPKIGTMSGAQSGATREWLVWVESGHACSQPGRRVRKATFNFNQALGTPPTAPSVTFMVEAQTRQGPGKTMSFVTITTNR